MAGILRLVLGRYKRYSDGASARQTKAQPRYLRSNDVNGVDLGHATLVLLKC
jgi:hypothetical protein